MSHSSVHGVIDFLKGRFIILYDENPRFSVNTHLNTSFIYFHEDNCKKTSVILSVNFQRICIRLSAKFWHLSSLHLNFIHIIDCHLHHNALRFSIKNKNYCVVGKKIFLKKSTLRVRSH